MSKTVVGGRLVLAAFLLIPQATASQESAPSQESEFLDPTWLEGTVGKDEAVRVFLETAGHPKEDGLWGVYYSMKNWEPIPLEGDWTSPGRIRMDEGDPNPSQPVPRARVNLDLTTLANVTGTWTSADGRTTLPVRLHQVSEPPRFEVAVQKARRFADARWPIEFDYPDGWHLETSDDQLTLQSPDPNDMLVGKGLSCKRGRGLPDVPGAEEPPVFFEGSFHRARNGWLVVESMYTTDCDAGRCRAPEARRVGSWTFLRTSSNYRSHNWWGYAGIGESQEYLVTEGDDWVHCDDRLLDSADRIQPRKISPRDDVRAGRCTPSLTLVVCELHVDRDARRWDRDTDKWRAVPEPVKPNVEHVEGPAGLHAKCLHPATGSCDLGFVASRDTHVPDRRAAPAVGLHEVEPRGVGIVATSLVGRGLNGREVRDHQIRVRSRR